MAAHALDRSRPLAAGVPVPVPPAAGTWAHDSAHLLQRTQALINDVPADPRYWTAYDHFILEREARALRRAYLGGLIATAWTRLQQWFATTPGPAGR
jgi:hypothetical protein